MATQLKIFWKFATTYDLLTLGKPADALEAGAEVSKAVLEFAIALGLLAAVPAAAVPAAPIAAAGLSFVGIARKGVKLYREKTNQELSLEEWVAMAFPLAYLGSFNDLVQRNELLQPYGTMPISEPVRQQIERLREFQLDENLARNALGSVHESELARVFNQVLSSQLQDAGMDEQQAQIVTGWVAWGTHQKIKELISYESDSVKHIADIYSAGSGKRSEKYDSIDTYLEEQIATKPLETVFVESFTFKDIYVPLKAKPVDQNGDVDEKLEAFDLETWAKNILNEPQKQNQVMFIQGGPGRGKSVSCRMFADWVRQHLHPIWTPVLIRLRDIRTFEKNFQTTLRAAVKADFAASDDGWLTDRTTRFLFLLDGFDELLMERRTSEGLKEFLQQVGQFQRDCQQSKEMGHRVLITGRNLALHSIERLMPSNLERVEIVRMDDELQQQWLSKWEVQVGTDKTSAFEQFLQDKRCPERVQELAQEPLLLYLLAAMHRDGELTVEMFEGASGTTAKILIYEKSLDWVLTEQRPELLNRELTEQDTEDLRRILTEAGLCVVQSGGECASVTMIEERLKGDNEVKALLEEARERLKDNPLRNALAAFYLQPVDGSKDGTVEFAHKSFGEFLCAERLKESLENWTQLGKRGRGFSVPDEQMHWEIYDLLGYGGLTPEIVGYLMALLTTPPAPPSKGGAREGEFSPVQLFKRLKDFYLRWCEGEFIDIAEEILPHKKARQLQKQGIQLGQRQVDVYAGLNVMILLLELHRYALSRERDDLKDQIAFYPCGQKDTEGFDKTRLLRIIGYRDCIGISSFLKTVGQFLGGANLSGADLSRANLYGANLSGANLSGADLSRTDLIGTALRSADLRSADLRSADLYGADLSGADLRGADLSGADLRGAYLSGANFYSADLRSADLRSAYLSGANLYGANLYGADLRGAYLSGAYLSGASLENISWDEKTKWKNVLGLETIINLPDALKQKLGLR